MAHTLYTLSFGTGEDTAVFYVGCTNNARRRESEHRTNPFKPDHNEYNTFKYQFIRQLKELGVEFAFTALHEIEEEQDAEYEWVLQFARANQAVGRTFIDGHPLTNMKAGDFLSEILNRPEVRTRSDIVQYRASRANRVSSLERGESPSPRAATNEAWIRIQADLAAAKKPERHYTMTESLDLHEERLARIRAETEILMERQAELDAKATS